LVGNKRRARLRTLSRLHMVVAFAQDMRLTNDTIAAIDIG